MSWMLSSSPLHSVRYVGSSEEFTPNKNRVNSHSLISGNNYGKDKERKKPCLLRETCSERLLGVKTHRIIPGHNKSCSSQKPSLWDPTSLRCACKLQGGFWDKWTRANKQGDWPEGRWRPRKLSLCKEFTLPTGFPLSLSEVANPCALPDVLFLSINFFLYSLSSASSSELVLD